MASPTTNKGYIYPAHNGSINSWDTPIDADFDQIDLNVGGPYNLEFGSTIAGANFNSTYATLSSTVSAAVLPSSNAQNLYYAATGVLTQNVTVTFPAAGGHYIINNGTTGAFTLTANTAAGGSSGKPIVQNFTQGVVSDSVNIYAMGGLNPASTVQYSPGMDMLSYTTMTSTYATIVVNVSGYSSTLYNAYRINFYNVVPVTQTTSTSLTVHFSSDGSTFAGSYQWAYDGHNTTDIDIQTGAGGVVSSGVLIQEAGPFSGDVTLYDPTNNAVPTQLRSNLVGQSAGGGFNVLSGVIASTVLQVVKAVQFRVPGGVTSGSFSLYGLK